MFDVASDTKEALLVRKGGAEKGAQELLLSSVELPAEFHT